MWTRRLPLALLFTAGVTAGAQVHAQGEPLSVIDWLSQSVREPPLLPESPGERFQGLTDAPISAEPLGQTRLDSVGLIPTAVSGFPAGLWGETPVSELSDLILRQRTEAVPELSSLLIRLLVSELDPPLVDDAPGQLFLARIDKLLEMGALDPAMALVERGGTERADVFRRWFDISLLLGLEDRACAAMMAAPDLAPTLTARIFCLARQGDWNAAALTLSTGEALGFLDEAEADLLARFLDPDLFEDDEGPPPPLRLTPLELRIRDATGMATPIGGQPVAFAHVDLAPTAGWKARIEAAERLARVGAVPPETLFGLYSERMPAASGGVWDRVALVQSFDIALLARDSAAAAETLPRTMAAMGAVGLDTAFARHFADRVLALPLLDTPARPAVLRLLLLSDRYEAAARTIEPETETETEAFLLALARGRPGEVEPPRGAMNMALVEAFGANGPPASLREAIEADRLGEALLRAMLLLRDGARSDPQSVQAALSTLRAIGLEAEARRVALHLALTQPR